MHAEFVEFSHKGCKATAVQIEVQQQQQQQQWWQ